MLRREVARFVRLKRHEEKELRARAERKAEEAAIAAQRAHGVKLAVSRDAELRADLAAADAFGANALISALKKIDAAAAKAPADLRSSAEGRKMAFAMISDGPSQQAPSSRTPSTSESSWSSQLGRAWRRASRLVRTHPPIEERIAALTRAKVE